jgi:hypothetical protein
MNKFCDFSSEKSRLTRIGSEGFEAAETEGIAVGGIEMLLRPFLFCYGYPKPG